MGDGPNAFNSDGTLSSAFTDARKAFNTDDVALCQSGNLWTRHQIQAVSAVKTFCEDTVLVITCSCGACFSYVSTSNGGCGADHHPRDLQPADEWHRSLVLFAGTKQIDIDQELVLRDHSLVS